MSAQEPNQKTVIFETNAQDQVIISAINSSSSSNDNISFISEALHFNSSHIHGKNTSASTEAVCVYGKSKSMQETSTTNYISLISSPFLVPSDGVDNVLKKISQPQPSYYYSDKQDHIELNKKLALISIRGNGSIRLIFY